MHKGHRLGVCSTFIREVHVLWQCLVLTVVLQSRVEVVPAVWAEGLVDLLGQFFVKAAQEALVVDAHSLEEAHLQFLAISAQLGCHLVALALELFF